MPSSQDSGFENTEDDEVEQQQRFKEKKALDSLTSEQDLQLHEFITKRIRKATLIENIGSEMTYSISNNPEYTKSYEAFFADLENNMDRFGIASVGISDTTLEEIFIKIASESKSNQFQQAPFTLCGLKVGVFFSKLKCWREQPPVKKLTSEESQQLAELTKDKVTGKYHLVGKQLAALLLKRLHRTKRNIKGIIKEWSLNLLFILFIEY